MTQKQLERQISQTYGQAQKEIAKYTEDYFEKFQARDEVKRQQVADGIITEDEYQGWLDGQKAYMARNEQLLNAVTKEYENADKTAEKWINGELPYAYVEGYNATGKGIEGEVTGYSFSMIDKNAVKAMMDDGDIPITTYTAGTEKHTAYVDKKARQAITQGIIQGDSVADVSKKVSQSLGVVTDKERKATIRNTRTLMNSAHNSGGYEAMADASEDGIILDKQWIATKDEVTRDSHAFLDGEIVKWDKPFSNGLMFPQDYNGEPSEVYNCRCTMREVVKGFYNKYTGKTEMLGEVPQEEYAEKAQEYWDNVRGEEYESSQPAEMEDAPVVKEDKFVFQEAKTRQEAEDYARDVLGITDVSYDGISLERANITNEELTRLFNKYDVPPFDAITTNEKGKCVASVSQTSDDKYKLNLNKKSDGSKGNDNFAELTQAFARSENAHYKEVLETGMEYGKPVSNARLRQYEKIVAKNEDTLAYDRWYCYNNGYKSTIDHEFGHYVAVQKTGNYSTPEVKEAYYKAHENGDIHKVSKYGSTDADEFFAESFSIMESGEELPPYIEDAVRGVTGVE